MHITSGIIGPRMVRLRLPDFSIILTQASNKRKQTKWGKCKKRIKIQSRFKTRLKRH